MSRVPPDGPVPCEWAIVGESPASEEVAQGRGFVGPSGALLWPLMKAMAGLERRECYVTNLSKTPLDNDLPGDEKMTPGEFADCQRELFLELEQVQPSRILAVGALAAKALLGIRYTNMTTCNGIGFPYQFASTMKYAAVVPTWHPAAALRGTLGEKDSLAFTAAAMKRLRQPTMHPAKPEFTGITELGQHGTSYMVPAPDLWQHSLVLLDGLWGVDTEGAPDDPICMTVSDGRVRWYVEPEDVARWFASLAPDAELVFHNAPWDWPVLWAMGAPGDLPERWGWRDTMELAYLAQTEPQGLKDLAYRHLGLVMMPFEDLVKPYRDEMAGAVARGLIGAGTTFVDKRVGRTIGFKHTSAKGVEYKKPKPIREYRIEQRAVLAAGVKPLQRAMGNPELLLKRLGEAAPPMSLRLVPEKERREYATLDAWATVKLLPKLLAMGR